MSGDEYAVQSLGEDIGYGELMSIASRLWREYLKDLGVGESGAFVPVIIQNGVMIDESGARFTLTPLDIEAGKL